MDFNLNEETVLMKDSAQRFLQKKCPSSLVRELIKDEVGYSKDIWKEMTELGWLGFIHKEKYGGFDGSFFDLFILFEQIGRVLLPSPFLCSTVLSGLIIDEAGNEKQKDEYLRPIIEGEKIFTTALLDENGRYDANDPKIEAAKTRDNAYVVNGTRLLVPYAHVADGIIVCANVKDSKAGGSTLFIIERNADGQEKTPLDTMSVEKSFAVDFKNVKLPAESIVGAPGKGERYLSKILPKATILKCGEMLGGLERVVEMTVEYVKQRHQFDRPLGSLQVIQHYCADMATDLESARLIARQAASLLSENIPCEKEISMAKAWCNEAYRKATWTAQQVHGGMGFTEEYDLHLFYKHAKASELAFESSWFHRSKVADAMGI